MFISCISRSSIFSSSSSSSGIHTVESSSGGFIVISCTIIGSGRFSILSSIVAKYISSNGTELLLVVCSKCCLSGVVVKGGGLDGCRGSHDGGLSKSISAFVHCGVVMSATCSSGDCSGLCTCHHNVPLKISIVIHHIARY